MQITKETFWWLLSKNGEDISVDMLYDPETNIKYGTYFLSILYEESDRGIRYTRHIMQAVPA